MAVQKKYNRNAKTNALGRGLDALISTETVSTQGSSTINEVALDQIEANPTSRVVNSTLLRWKNWPTVFVS